MKARLAPPITILAMGLFILQTHSIGFWTKAVGRSTGCAWSILLELISLWLWSLKSASSRILGGLTTLVLLTGPLYEVSSPIIQDFQVASQSVGASDKKIDLLEESVRLHKDALKVFLANSQSRPGWSQLISGAEASLHTALGDLKRAQEERAARITSAPRLSGQALLILALQILSIVVFQSINVFAVTQIAAHFVRAPGAASVEAGGDADVPPAAREASADRPVAAPADFPVDFPRGPKVENRNLETGKLEFPGTARLENLRIETGKSLENGTSPHLENGKLENPPAAGLENGKSENRGSKRLENPRQIGKNQEIEETIQAGGDDLCREILGEARLAAARECAMASLADNKTTKGELSSALGISRRDLSLILHFDTAVPGRRKPSRDAIAAILERFGQHGLGAGQ
jgi:hypothetical protein